MTIRSQYSEEQLPRLQVALKQINQFAFYDVQSKVFHLSVHKTRRFCTLFTCSSRISQWINDNGLSKIEWYPIETFSAMFDNVPEKAMIEILPVYYEICRKIGYPLLRDRKNEK